MKYFFGFIIGLLVGVGVGFFGSYQWVLTSASESVAALLDEGMVLLNEDIDSSDVQGEAKRIFDEQKEKLVELVEKEKQKLVDETKNEIRDYLKGQVDEIIK